MNSMDMVTKFQVRKDHWITPVGTFEYHGHAKTACEAADLIPESNIRHEIEMAKVADVVAEINAYVKQFNVESLDYLTLSSAIKYEAPDTLVPVKRVHMVAYAVEGSNEGYYVHFGTFIRNEDRKPKAKLTSEYMDFGFAKVYSREDASLLATEIQRWLTATDWN
jgi:hypothetical protein